MADGVVGGEAAQEAEDGDEGAEQKILHEGAPDGAPSLEEGGP
jgi:hypothetical protein